MPLSTLHAASCWLCVACLSNIVCFLSFNKMSSPLDKKCIAVAGAEGTSQTLPALDIRWTMDREFATYLPLLTANGAIKTGVDLEEWQHVAEAVQDDMEFLLRLSQNEFWSYMCYRDEPVAAINAFLQNTNPFYASALNKHTEATAIPRKLYKSILQLVVRIVQRLLTAKESDSECLSTDHHKNLLYDKCLITVPLLVDLVVAVGDRQSAHESLLSGILNTACDIQPKYKEDFRKFFSYFNEAFQSIQVQVQYDGFNGATGGVAEVDTTSPDATSYDDVIYYVLDCACTIRVLLNLAPKLLLPISKEIQLAKTIAEFYDGTIPRLHDAIHAINREAPTLKLLNVARLQFLKGYYSIAFSYIERALNGETAEAEKFLELLSEALSLETFAMDYELCYPIESDIELLKKAKVEFDSMTTDYIVGGYKGFIKDHNTLMSVKKARRLQCKRLLKVKILKKQLKPNVFKQPDGASTSGMKISGKQSKQQPKTKQTNQQPKIKQTNQQATVKPTNQQPKTKQSKQQPKTKQTNQQPTIKPTNQQSKTKQTNQQPKVKQTNQQSKTKPANQQPKTKQTHQPPTNQQGKPKQAKQNANEDQLDTKVKSILEIFPDLGSGFIRKLALRYDEAEEAIAAILEDNLPPDLADADRTEVFIPDEQPTELFLKTGIMRRNVFDGDQYDVMTQDKPNCIIKLGKGFPGQPQNTEQLLNDKSHVRALKERYQQYGLVAEYDDEYDDSYDCILASESKVRRHNVGPAENDVDEDLSPSDAEAAGPSNRNKRDEFCENPEVARARYAAARAQRGGRRGPPPQTHDVVGAPKGQGQSVETVRNRNKKEANKAYHGNHNRKSGAAYKRRAL